MNGNTFVSPVFDEDGFLRNANSWSEELARRIAHMDGIDGLNEHQLRLLKHLRDAYRRQESLPALPHVCRLGGFEPDCMTRLFPSAREVWRLAGLPNPGEEAKAYM